MLARHLLCSALALLACESPLADLDASIGSDSGPTARPDAGPDAGPPADLDGYVEWQMTAGGIPGAALAIVKDGAIAWIGTYGYADIESARAVDAHTLFIMASISKTIAVTRAMQLVEEGLLDLDAPLETYVPYAVRHPAHPSVAITMRMLLTHTSGLSDNFAVLAGVSVNGSDPSETLGGFAEGYVTPGGAYFRDSNFGAQPGTRRAYCNAGFGVIGDVIERAGGSGFRAQTGAGVFDPLDMDGAGWFLADVDAARLATPYAYNGRAFTALQQSGMAFYPAGSLRVSVTGLARFLLAIGGGGELDGTRILSEESVTEMLRAQVPALDRSQALTFSYRTVNGHRYVGHSGETFGGSTQMLLSREGNHGIILITNSDAYVRSTFGLDAGADAMDAILARLDDEALAL